MTEEFCINCIRPEHQHILGRCPSLGIHIEIDADSVNRARATGHPRLLRAVIDGTQKGVMIGVHVERLHIMEVLVG